MNIQRTAGILVLLTILGVSQAAPQTIRIGSTAPQDSPWGRALNQLASDWSDISNGRINLQIYHGGIAGDEADVLRKIRINQLQAGALTSGGMNSLTSEMLTLSAPMLIQTDDEFEYVFEHIRPQLEESLRAERLHVLGWSFAGWVHFFSRNAIATPADLKQTRIATTPTEPEIHRAFQLMGYNTVSATINEILPGLNSGMIDSFFTSPLAAAGFQYFAIADHMLDIPVAPFLGVVVISDRLWQRLPADLRDQLEQAAQQAIHAMEAEVRHMTDEAINTMQQYGLTVIRPEGAQKQLWLDEFNASREVAVGRVFDQDTYETIESLLEEYRSR